MARSAAQRIVNTPEFKALDAAYRAMKPLDPEGRRKVVEALHTLLKISPGRNQKK